MDALEVPADRIGAVKRGPLASALLQPRVLPLAGLLAAGLAVLLLRAVPWLANLPLHHDEALYGTWARAIADGSDPLLLVPWVDKPPLVLYLLGLSIKLFGASELALRVPGMIASVLTVWATYGLARRVVGGRGAWVAAGLVALSPFAILFGPTAFTDGWLTLFLIAAAWAALAGRPGWAGVLLGLACASKQQGVLGVPLVAALMAVQALEAHPSPRGTGYRLLAALGLAALGFATVFGAVTYWDSLRWHNRPSYWGQSLRTYGGVVLAALALWPQRAGEWARQAGYWFGAWPVTLALVVAASLGAGLGRPRIRLGGRPRIRPQIHELRTGAGGAGERVIGRRLVLMYVLGYLVVHVGFTFQPWDRYLLPVLPLVCVLLGQGLVATWDSLGQVAGGHVRRWAAAGLPAVLLVAASLGLSSAIPVGSDIGAYQGVAEAARFLSAEPPGATVYFDRIGWHLDYYLYGRPITRSWYDSPQKLASETARVAAQDAAAAQWLALPAWEEPQRAGLDRALGARGFVARPAYEVRGRDGTTDLTLYRLEPETRAAGNEGLSR